MKAEPLMNEASLDADWADTKQALQVFIAFDDLAAGRRAMHVLAGLGRGLGDSIDFRPFLWQFDLLIDRNWRDVAADDARNAEILIIAASDTNPLPLAVERWIEAAFTQKRGTDAAIVALFGTEENPEEADFSRFDALRSAAQRAGLAFFARVAHRELDEAVLRIHQHAEVVTPPPGEILRQSHPPPHWGINE